MGLLISRFTSPVLHMISLIALSGMLHACKDSKRRRYINEAASVYVQGIPFSIERAIFLTQYTNPSSRTTSWVLGDSSFIYHQQTLAHFLSDGGKDKLCILHWSQKDDPVWIGARIPGRFLWADLLMYEMDTLVVKQYHPNRVTLAANESYKMEVESLLRELNVVVYP